MEISNVLKFGVNRAYIERDTAIQKLQNLLRNNRRCVQQSIHLLQSNQVKRTPQDSISELIIRKMTPLVVPVTDVKFKAAFLHA